MEKTVEAILDALKKGNPEIVNFFVEAEKIWSRILSDINSVSVEELAKRLHLNQHLFEDVCGERHLGKLIMAWSAYPHFYSREACFGDNGKHAYKLMQAFASSYCAVEVKHAAKEAAQMYGVSDFA